MSAPLLECLEDRLAPAIMVTKNFDDGSPGTLSAAILQANANPNSTIDFNINAQLPITFKNAPPAITQPTTVDGLSQGGPLNTTVLVELKGTGITGDGLTVISGGVIIEGLAIDSFTGNGVSISQSGATGDSLAGMIIGTDPTGTKGGIGNTGDGVRITGNFNSVTGSVISGNGLNGIEFASPASGNWVDNNYIGVGSTGNAPLAKGSNGVYGNNVQSNTIGGANGNTNGPIGKFLGNVISGNGMDGIQLTGTSSNNVLDYDFVGVGADGKKPIKNGNNGIKLSGGGSDTIYNDVIPGNAREGVWLSASSNNTLSADYIGVGNDGTTKVANTFDGVLIASGSTLNQVRASVISGNSQDGVKILEKGTSQNLISNDDIGVALNGTTAVGNTLNGVEIGLGAWGNTVGSSTSPATVISGNGADGVKITDSGTIQNLVVNSYIGVASDGKTMVANSVNGVEIANQASSNTVGAAGTASLNVISGNSNDGVKITGSGTTQNQVMNSYIGLASDGTTKVGNVSYGVEINSASSNTIGSNNGAPTVISGNALGTRGSGVFLYGNSNQVVNCYIGTDKTGTQSAPNYDGLTDQGTGNVIGLPSPASFNVISGNSDNGLQLMGTKAVVLNNYIGTDFSGTKGLGNGHHGVYLAAATGCTIGAAGGVRSNLICKNAGDGIQVARGSTSDLIVGNWIGVGWDSFAKLPVVLGNTRDGVSVDGTSGTITIGGTAAGTGNLISCNQRYGIELLSNTNSYGNNTVGLGPGGEPGTQWADLLGWLSESVPGSNKDLGGNQHP
jgi:hypothetical protein